MKKENEISGIEGRTNVFSVPEGYFAGLADEIMSHVHLSGCKKDAARGPYSIPAGYFDTVAGNILDKMKAGAATMESEASDENSGRLLASIGRGNTYMVPDLYFEQLPAQIIARTATAAPSKVISIRSLTRRWVSYASAAAVAGIMIVGAFMFTDNNEESPSGYYNNLRGIDVTKGVSDLSESEISTYLTAHPAVFDIKKGGATQNAEAAIQTSIQHISEEEINNYLKENWEPGENALKGI